MKAYEQRILIENLERLEADLFEEQKVFQRKGEGFVAQRMQKHRLQVRGFVDFVKEDIESRSTKKKPEEATAKKKPEEATA